MRNEQKKEVGAMMSEYKLMLYPAEPDLVVDLNTLKKHLNHLKLLGMELTSSLGNNHYAVGESFLSYFTFMGCSPDIELDPQPDKPFCYIALHSTSATQFVSGANLKKSRCTSCKNELKNVSTTLLCPHCDNPLELDKINWRKSAFTAKTWITIGNIYELEAIPNDELLDSLKKLTGVQWKPAYIRHMKLLET